MDDSGKVAPVTAQIAGQRTKDGRVEPVMASDDTF